MADNPALSAKLNELRNTLTPEGRFGARPGTAGSLWSCWRMDALVLHVTRTTCRCCGNVHSLPGRLYVQLTSGGLHNAGERDTVLFETAVLRFARAFQCSEEEAKALHFPKLPHKTRYLDNWCNVCHSCWTNASRADNTQLHAGLPRNGPRMVHPPMLPVAMQRMSAPVASPNATPTKPNTSSRRAKPRHERGKVQPATDKELF